MNNQISGISRWLMLLCAGALVMVLLVPLWRIDLDAPQYPEGLMLQIYPHKLGGDVEIINGLNHYIGMKTLHSEDFIEFTVLPYIIGFFALAALLVAVIRKKIALYTFFIAFVTFGIVAMVDFWRWEYDYGHDLDPNAAIQVPGMAYQPPLIGFKQLLNFGAYSIPDTGGWLFVGVGVIALLCTLAEWKGLLWSKSKIAKMFVLALAMMSVQSCSTGPEPIKVGEDQCSFCKMKIAEIHFGAEVVTAKGKIFKFDDIICAAQFINRENLVKDQLHGVYVSNYVSGNELLDVNECNFFKSESFRSPMNGNIAAFADLSQLENTVAGMTGEKITWENILAAYK